jgi:uroporphyrinogen decarboxylase
MIMNSAERMGAVMMGRKPDRVPVLPFIHVAVTKTTGITYKEFWTDPDLYFDAHFQTMRLFGYEQTPLFGYAACGPKEFGGKVGVPEEDGAVAPYVIEPLVRTIEDIDKLEVPVFTEGDLPGNYWMADRVGERATAMGMPVGFQAGSIFSAAAQIADTTTFLSWTITEQDAVHKLMDKVSDMYVGALEYFANKFGPQNCLPFQAGPMEANGMISADNFKKLVYPYLLKVNRKIQELGIMASFMHPCADQNGNIPGYIEMREACGWHGRYIWLFGPETPLGDQMKAFGAHDIICGSIDPAMIHEKSYAQVVALCKEVIEVGKDNPGGFLLSAGCDFPVEAAPIKMMAFMDAAEQYGRY